jgi:opacity protein-like surface antigen
MKKSLLALTLVITSTTLAAAEPASPIPDRTTVGIGLGIENRQLGGLAGPGVGLLSGPNVGSLRIRFPSGLSIEPSVAVARGGAEFSGGGDASMTTLSAGAALRFGVARRGPVQLLGVAGVGVSRSSSEQGVGTSTSTSAQVSWGIAIDYWLQQHLALSMSATNPLVSHTGVRDSYGGMEETIYAATTYGLQFDPTIAMMVHLFY